MGYAKKRGFCPCGSRTGYLTCCGRFVDEGELPATPAELMRSRYTAYAVGEVDYIIETTDPEGAAWEADKAAWRASAAEFGRSSEFLGVEILGETVEGDRGTVTFRAKLRQRNGDASFSERSEFVRRDGRWLYSSGEPV